MNTSAVQLLIYKLPLSSWWIHPRTFSLDMLLAWVCICGQNKNNTQLTPSAVRSDKQSCNIILPNVTTYPGTFDWNQLQNKHHHDAWWQHVWPLDNRWLCEVAEKHKEEFKAVTDVWSLSSQKRKDKFSWEPNPLHCCFSRKYQRTGRDSPELGNYSSSLRYMLLCPVLWGICSSRTATVCDSTVHNLNQNGGERKTSRHPRFVWGRRSAWSWTCHVCLSAGCGAVCKAALVSEGAFLEAIHYQ